MQVNEGKMEYGVNLDLSWNDIVSSVKVTPGCIFKGYRGLVKETRHDGGHPMVELTQDSDLQGDKNDHLSSWTCQCDKGKK